MDIKATDSEILRQDYGTCKIGFIPVHATLPRWRSHSRHPHDKWANPYNSSIYVQGNCYSSRIQFGAQSSIQYAGELQSLTTSGRAGIPHALGGAFSGHSKKQVFSQLLKEKDVGRAVAAEAGIALVVSLRR